jgi:hypothetical protein
VYRIKKLKKWRRSKGLYSHRKREGREGKDTQLSQPKEANTTTTTTYVRIWGKYLYTTSAATKAAVSPITTNLKHLMMAILAETCSEF